MQEPIHPLAVQRHFISELIAIYKEHPVLWDKNHPNYRKKSERSEAHEVLVQKCREYYPDADEDFVKLRIDSLRSCFRKEWNKVCFSKGSAQTPEDVYKPTLWYYNLLLYTVGEECSEEPVSENFPRYSFWSREYTTILIDLFKKHPILYSGDFSSNLIGKRAAVRKITEEINAITGKLFTTKDVQRKIRLLKDQYRKECRSVFRKQKSSPKVLIKSSCWCFDKLDFLKACVLKKKFVKETSKMQEVKEEIDTEECEDDINENNDNKNGSVTTDSNDADYDDIYDTIGRNVAHKLRDMPDDQRLYAERLINEILYHGQMGNLTEATRLCIDF